MRGTSRKARVREAVVRIGRLEAALARYAPAALLRELGTIRSLVLNVDSETSWRDNFDVVVDVAHTVAEAAEFLGISERTVQRELRRRGISLKRGPKKNFTTVMSGIISRAK